MLVKRIYTSFVLDVDEIAFLEEELKEKREKFPELDIQMDNIIGSYVISQIMLMKTLKMKGE